MHTFGIGSGVSTELIVECAKAGNGNHTFIYDLDEIESKVISSLQKNMFEYLSIQHLKFLDENQKVVHFINNVGMLSHRDKFSFTTILPENVPEVKYCEFSIINPSTNHIDVQITEIISCK